MMYKILIVDDEEMIREGIKAVIPWDEIEIDRVEVASSGKEALALMEKEAPDILLTDISMAEMSGLDMIERMNDLCHDMRMIVLTGYDSFEYAKKALKLRVNDFLLKPVAEEILKESIWKQICSLKESEAKQEEELRKRRTEGIGDQQRLEKVLQRIVHYGGSKEELECIREEYHYQTDEDMTIAVLIPTYYMNEESDVKIKSERQSLQLCIDYIDVKKLGISFWDENGKQIVIALYSARCSSDGVDVVRNLAYRMRDELGQMPRTAIGSVTPGMKNLNRSYKEAVYMIENEQRHVKDVLLSQSLEKKSTLFHEIYEMFINEMTENIQTYSYVMRVYDSFCKAVRAYNLSEAYVRKCCFNIASQMYYTKINTANEKPELSLEILAETLRGNDIEDCCRITEQFLVKLLSREDGEHELVEKAKHCISEQISEDISVSALAETLNVSLSYFSRLFKKVTGEGCNEYIMKKRMEKAKMLLDTTNFDTATIADMVGYRDSNYFSGTFKKYYGESPRQYRKG